MKKQCSFEECDRTTLARGLCGGHYQQQRRGQPLRRLFGQFGGKKICSTCKVDKPVEDFYKKASGHYFSECRGCAKSRVAGQYRMRHGN